MEGMEWSTRPVHSEILTMRQDGKVGNHDFSALLSGKMKSQTGSMMGWAVLLVMARACWLRPGDAEAAINPGAGCSRQGWGGHAPDLVAGAVAEVVGGNLNAGKGPCLEVAGEFDPLAEILVGIATAEAEGGIGAGNSLYDEGLPCGMGDDGG